MIVSVGVDIVDVGRVQRLLDRHGQPFLERVFTPEERTYCLAGPRPGERLAARFAAKEAVMKCLGTGHARGVGFHQIEVLRRPSGEVAVALRGAAQDVGQQLGIGRIHLSLSHTAGQAIAFAVAESAATDNR